MNNGGSWDCALVLEGICQAQQLRGLIQSLLKTQESSALCRKGAVDLIPSLEFHRPRRWILSSDSHRLIPDAGRRSRHGPLEMDYMDASDKIEYRRSGELYSEEQRSLMPLGEST